MLTDLRISEFLDETAAGTAVPGGGSIAALCACAAAALVSMVAGLTLGKKGYESAEAEMTRIRNEALRLKKQTDRAVDADAEAYAKVMQALALPRQTPEETVIRTEVLEETLKGAARAPLAVAEDALEIMDLAETAFRMGNRNAMTDAVVAVLAARTALRGSLYNVKTNLRSIRDAQFVAATRKDAERIALAGEEKEARILASADVEMERA